MDGIFLLVETDRKERSSATSTVAVVRDGHALSS